MTLQKILVYTSATERTVIGSDQNSSAHSHSPTGLTKVGEFTAAKSQSSIIYLHSLGGTGIVCNLFIIIITKIYKKRIIYTTQMCL